MSTQANFILEKDDRVSKENEYLHGLLTSLYTVTLSHYFDYCNLSKISAVIRYKEDAAWEVEVALQQLSRSRQNVIMQVKELCSFARVNHLFVSVCPA